MRFFDNKPTASERELNRIENAMITAIADRRHHSEKEVKQLTEAWVNNLMKNAQGSIPSKRTRMLAEQPDSLRTINRSRG